MNLKEAREKGKLDEFIKEHEKDKPGDAERLDKALKKIVKPSSQTVQSTDKTKTK